MRAAGPALAATVSFVIAIAALGQEQYELSESDIWEKVDTVDPDTPQGRLALARQALATGDTRRAENLASSWIERYPKEPGLPEAYLIRGDALKTRGDYYKALFDYEYVARAFPASETFVTVLQRELEIGTLYATGTKRKWFGLRVLNAGDVAEELLIRVQERMPGSHLAEQAAMELADYYFRNRKMELAVQMYSIFLENFPSSSQVSKARRRLIYAELATFKGPAFDASGLHEARARLFELKALEPANAERIGADALLSRIDESDAQKLLLTARWYLRTGDPVAAELMIRRLIDEYPRTVAAVDALRLVEEVEPKLPPAVLREAPDYQALREAMLGNPPESDTP